MDVVRLLEGAGVDVNAQDKLAMTPLHHAAVNGQETAVAELLSRGARMDTKLSVRVRTHCHALFTLRAPINIPRCTFLQAVAELRLA